MTTRVPLLTTKLNNGTVVLAKMYAGEPSAVTYANRTQANRKAEFLRADGYSVDVVCFGRPWYVRINSAAVAKLEEKSEATERRLVALGFYGRG
jgi:hypothetical protein